MMLSCNRLVSVVFEVHKVTVPIEQDDWSIETFTGYRPYTIAFEARTKWVEIPS